LHSYSHDKAMVQGKDDGIGSGYEVGHVETCIYQLSTDPVKQRQRLKLRCRMDKKWIQSKYGAELNLFMTNVSNIIETIFIIYYITRFF
jgi:hypothetical protein